MSTTAGYTFKDRGAAQHGSLGTFVIHSILRLGQFAAGLAVMAIYFSLIKQEAQPFGATTTPPEWMGLVVGVASALAALVELLPYFPPIYFPIDATLW